MPLVPLAVIILGRDVLLGLSAFRIRYTSLPHPVRVAFSVPLFAYNLWSCGIDLLRHVEDLCAILGLFVTLS